MGLSRKNLFSAAQQCPGRPMEELQAQTLISKRNFHAHMQTLLTPESGSPAEPAVDCSKTSNIKTVHYTPTRLTGLIWLTVLPLLGATLKEARRGLCSSQEASAPGPGPGRYHLIHIPGTTSRAPAATYYMYAMPTSDCNPDYDKVASQRLDP